MDMPGEVVAQMALLADEVKADFVAALGKDSARFITLKGGLRPLNETVGKDVSRFMQLVVHEKLLATFETVVKFILDFNAVDDETRASFAMWQRFMDDVVAQSDFLSSYRQVQREMREIERYLELCRIGMAALLFDTDAHFRVYAIYMEALLERPVPGEGEA